MMGQLNEILTSLTILVTGGGILAAVYTVVKKIDDSVNNKGNEYKSIEELVIRMEHNEACIVELNTEVAEVKQKLTFAEEGTRELKADIRNMGAKVDKIYEILLTKQD